MIYLDPPHNYYKRLKNSDFDNSHHSDLQIIVAAHYRPPFFKIFLSKAFQWARLFLHVSCWEHFYILILGRLFLVMEIKNFRFIFFFSKIFIFFQTFLHIFKHSIPNSTEIFYLHR